MTLPELIAKLEEAEEGSRHLDSWVAAYVGIGEWNIHEWLIVLKDPTFGPEPAIPEAPHYTTSIDAALTLVPERWLWHVGVLRHYRGDDWESEEGKLVYVAEVRPDGKIISPDQLCDGEGQSAAVSLCIAALRARAA